MLLQTWFGTRLLVEIGGSYVFIIPAISIVLSSNNNKNFTFLSPHQFLPYLMKSRVIILDQFAVLFSVAVVWVYVEILTVDGACDNKPTSTQRSCCTDRSGLLSAALWM
ncbi:hypothetical protein P3X46_013703 [Hevea brasiliensis]|uniref:Uncharacterized protein n=1 Tax=Hevea brasiliensis TaxID=3981 RepID=A0ABQ9M4I4_HEVBR|nr:hypothetical protein P3X46_013703 [Hevea brasiliensis]